MIRPGHVRPLGTTSRWRVSWNDPDRPPALGDLVMDGPDPELRQRLYMIVGVEEHRDSPAVWRVVVERVAWDRLQWCVKCGKPLGAPDGCSAEVEPPVWTFVKDRR